MQKRPYKRGKEEKMDRKMIAGIILTLVGLVFSVFSYGYTVMNPYVYNGTSGLMAGFLGNDTLIPFVLSTAVMAAGLLICLWEAYRRDR